VGVLAVQGAFAEHAAALAEVGAQPVLVRDAAGLEGLHALVIPGGESTTLRRVAGDSGLLDALRAEVAAGLPTLGTCAGLIALADEIADGDPVLVGGLDVTVRRNAYGRQVASFEAPVDTPGLGGGSFTAVFIRAPWVERVGPGVDVVAELDGRPVAVRRGDLMGVAFHPELTGERRFHEWLVHRARERGAETAHETTEERRVGAQ
jgi:5'-phosphate synthase pdxT subunit